LHHVWSRVLPHQHNKVGVFPIKSMAKLHMHQEIPWTMGWVRPSLVHNEDQICIYWS
jgi:hypothetical protein